jgi:hypothetical protein
MHSNAEDIREYASTLVEAARRSGKERLSLRAGDIHRELKLVNRVPAVCSVLGSKKFQTENRLRTIGRSGPASGQSTTTEFTYSLVDVEPLQVHKQEVFQSLRGIGKTIFAEYGGGQAFLESLREDPAAQ